VTRWLREPLVHFAVLGAALFALQRWATPPARDRIVVTAEVARGLRQDHARRYGAPPTAAEESVLVRRWVDDEVLVREATRLGLDRGDIIVRRRLIQKMQFLQESLARIPVPSDAELEAWLDAHATRYAAPARVSLTHVFVAADAHADPGTTAAQVAAALASGVDPARLGDPFLRGRDLPLQTESQLAGVFGASFASAVASLPAGTWSAPLRSSYGLHLVRVDAREAGRRPTLDEVRRAVTDDWTEARRDEATRTALDALRTRYRVVVEP